MASETGTNEAASEKMIDVILRSPDPTKLKDLPLRVPLRWNVEELKRLIEAEHPRRPNHSEQVLIYGGKVLDDGEAPLVRVLRRAETDEGPYTMHLTLRSEEPLTQSVSTPNLSSLHSSVPPRSASPPERAPATVTPTPVITLPLVMVNPVASAAYNAALAVAYNPEATRRGTGQGEPSQASSSQSAALPQNAQQQPMVPAIAFFPMGIPVLVPAAAAQTQGFQIGQSAAPIPQRPQTTSPQVRHVNRRRQQAPIHGRGPAGNPGRGRGVVVYRFSLRGLIQMALIIAVLYAYCSPEHFLVGVFLVVLLYLFVRPIRRFIYHYYNARDADGRPQARGVLHEMLAIVLTLLSSLFPGWNPNEAPAAPFARVIREEIPEPEHPIAQDRPHAD